MISMTYKEIVMNENQEKELEKKLAEEIELQYRLQVESLINDKKELEQKLYNAIDEAEYAIKKLDKARKLNSNILKGKNELLNLSLIGFLKAKRENKKKKKELKQQGIKYWAPVFDPEYYAKKYKDIGDSLTTDEQLLEHFLQYGVYEGRSGKKEFNAERYMDLNRDVEDYYLGDNLAACVHYIESGQFENRRA